MKKGILLVLVLGLMVFCATKDSIAQGGPKVEKVWASPEVAAGQMLKIYIKASAGEADMKYVQVTAKWGGEGVIPENNVAAAPIRLGKESRKALNGYLYLKTQKGIGEVEGTLEVVIEDWKGNASMPESVPVKIVGKGAKSEKPPSDFQEIAIGPLMVPPRPVGR